MGRRVAALLSLARAKWPTGILADEVVAVIRMIGLDAIGTALVELGLTADAVPLLRDAQALSARADLTLPPSLFPGLPEIPQQVEEHLNAALDGMSTSDLAAVAGQAIARAGEEQAGQVIDLTTLVHPRNLDQATVRSLFADSLAACDGGALAALEQPLEALRRAHPDDLSVAISAALLALAANDPGRVQSALEQLAALVEKTPIERLADGVRANAGARGSGEADPAVAGGPRVSQAGECVREDTSVRRSFRRACGRSGSPAGRPRLAAGDDARARSARLRAE